MAGAPRLTVPQAIRHALTELTDSIELSDLVERVLRLRPSESKGVRSRIKRKIQMEEAGRTIAMLSKETVVPLSMAAPGICFRVVLSEFEIEHGVLLADAAFNGWHQWDERFQEYEFIDDQSNAVLTRVVKVQREINGLLGDFTSHDPAFEFGAWYREHRATPGDSLLITIRSWHPKRLELSLESREKRDRRQQDIEHRDQELADRLFDVLEEARHEDVHSSVAIPTAHARLFNSVGYPGNPWPRVIEADARMQWNGLGITYADRLYPLELAEAGLLGEPLIGDAPLSPQEVEQVLRLRVTLRRRTGLWRILEIQGKQTLSELDSVIRDAFEYEPMEYLSGFAKLIPRSGSRFREIEIGTIDPNTQSGINGLAIGALGMQVGDRLRYVYDYSSPEEHEAVLEAIVPAEPDVEYPRLAERNKRRYHYCASCRSPDKRTIADYRCVECAEWGTKPSVYVCTECLEDKHITHYFEPMMY